MHVGQTVILIGWPQIYHTHGAVMRSVVEQEMNELWTIEGFAWAGEEPSPHDSLQRFVVVSNPNSPKLWFWRAHIAPGTALDLMVRAGDQ